MASTSQQQIAGQSSVLFKFDIPNYTDAAGLGRVVRSAGEALQSITPGVSNSPDSGGTTPLAGLLGPSSKAPRLIPNSLAPIDIKNDFAWTSSKSDAARADTPYVYLIEKIVDRSSRLQNTMYSTVATLQSPYGLAAGGYGGAVVGAKIAGAFSQNPAAKIGGAVVGGFAGATAANYLSETLLGGDDYTYNLQAFSGLYSTTKTNFSYKLPFVKTTGNFSKSIGQTWSEDSIGIGESVENIYSKFEGLAGSSATGLVGKAGNLLETAATAAKAVSDINSSVTEVNKNLFAAAYTESAKTFQYGSNLPGFEISFYLFNNLTWADTVKNWYAVFALQYQNLPNRLNRLILNPSVIYEAVIPGYFYSMYTYIKSLDVSFLGSNLLIDIPIIQTGSANDSVRNISTNENQPTYNQIKVIVPEVYKVTIQFESLVPESQNLLYEAMLQTRSNGGVTPSATTSRVVVGAGTSTGGNASSLARIPLGF